MTVCPVCQTPKPGSATQTVFGFKPTPPAAATQSAFGFKPSAPAAGTQSAFGFNPTAPAAGTESVFAFKPTVSSASTSAFSFGSPSGASAQPKAKTSPNVGLSFGGDKQATTRVKQTAMNQESGVPATTPGDTPTTRFSFDAGDSRSSGLPKFSFGLSSKGTEPTSSSFVFGTTLLEGQDQT